MAVTVEVHIKQLRALLMAKGKAGAFGGCSTFVEKLKPFWPSTSRDVHVYARDKSVDAFRIVEEDVRARVVNNAERKGRTYANYTDEGFTKGGARTAASYKSRAIQEAYSLQTFRDFKNEIRDGSVRAMNAVR